MPSDAQNTDLPLHELTAYELRERVASADVSAVAAVEELCDWIGKHEPAIKAYVTLERGKALARAHQIDERVQKGESVGKLAGVPVAVKDNMCTPGVRTTCSSKILADFVPPYAAHVVERLEAEDAIIIGKTNLDEFAMGSSTENSATEPTRNPWDTDRVPGGSSGGSAAAVAAGMAHLALGSDTGGSIRQPAALCGVVGLKPTYGRVSRYGLIAFASSLDQIGPFARNVRDAALLAEVISGYDRRDSTCADLPVPDYAAQLETAPKPLRIGVPKEYFGEGLDPEVEQSVRAALDTYAGMGAEIRDLSLPHTEYAVATYYILAPAEASSNLARYDGVHYGHRTDAQTDITGLFSQTRAEGFGEEVQRRILLGTYALSAGYYDAYYLKASKVRRLIRDDFDRAFEQVDCVICPTSPVPAFRVGERADDPLTMYLADVFTISANLAGIAGISIPCGFTQAGLPVGMQIIGPPFEELRLLQIAHLYEQATDHHKRRPPLKG